MDPEFFVNLSLSLRIRMYLKKSLSDSVHFQANQDRILCQSRIPRLIRMATALSGDGLLVDANDVAMKRLYLLLDGQAVQNKGALTKAKKDISTVQLSALKVALGEQVTVGKPLALDADTRTIDDAFRSGSRLLTKAVANGYQRHLVEKKRSGGNLIEAKLQVAAPAQIPEVVATLTAEAESLVNQWLNQFNASIKHLSDAVGRVRQHPYPVLGTSPRGRYDFPTPSLRSLSTCRARSIPPENATCSQ